ncbi:cupin-like domain-containing protein, partial [Xanthomonas oryzae pv. oryzae]
MAARATNLFVTAGTAIAERSDGGPDALPLAELCDAAEPVVLRGV